MALPAAVDGREAPLHDLPQDVVERADEIRRRGVVAALVLGDDLPVAAGAGVGGDDGRNRGPLVLEGPRLGRGGAVALPAADPLPGMFAQAPLRHDAGRRPRVTDDALPALLG